jgi:hypothetical protein
MQFGELFDSNNAKDNDDDDDDDNVHEPIAKFQCVTSLRELIYVYLNSRQGLVVTRNRLADKEPEMTFSRFETNFSINEQKSNETVVTFLDKVSKLYLICIEERDDNGTCKRIRVWKRNGLRFFMTPTNHDLATLVVFSEIEKRFGIPMIEYSLAEMKQ